MRFCRAVHRFGRVCVTNVSNACRSVFTFVITCVSTATVCWLCMLFARACFGGVFVFDSPSVSPVVPFIRPTYQTPYLVRRCCQLICTSTPRPVRTYRVCLFVSRSRIGRFVCIVLLSLHSPLLLRSHFVLAGLQLEGLSCPASAVSCSWGGAWASLPPSSSVTRMKSMRTCKRRQTGWPTVPTGTSSRFVLVSMPVHELADVSVPTSCSVYLKEDGAPTADKERKDRPPTAFLFSQHSKHNLCIVPTRMYPLQQKDSPVWF